MSDGRSFASTELSDQERIAELERKLPVLLESISQCDSLHPKIDNLANVVIGIATDLSGALKKIKELELQLSIIAQSHSKLEAEFKENKDRNDGLWIEAGVTMFKITSAATEADESLKKKMEESVKSLEEKLTTKADDVDVKILESNLRNSSDVYTKSFTGQIADIANRVSSFSGQISDQVKKYITSDDMDLIKGEILEVIKTGASLQKGILDQLQQDINGKVSQLYEEISLNSQKEAQNSPNFDDLSKEFDKKLQNVSLDASNATLRTQNSDQKISNLEKRIENIDLRLKRQEIPQ